MKKMVLGIAIILTATAGLIAQGYGDIEKANQGIYQGDIANFSIKEGKVLWQHVYSIDVMSDSLKNMLLRSLMLKEHLKYISVTDVGISCSLVNYEYDVKHYKTEKFWPDVFCRDINGSALIEIKDGKYRVTITELSSYNAPILFIWNDYLESNGRWSNYENTRKKLEMNSRALVDLFTIDKNSNDEW